MIKIDYLNYKELYEYLYDNDFTFNKDTFSEIKKHSNIANVEYWGMNGIFKEYALDIMTDSDVVYEMINLYILG